MPGRADADRVPTPLEAAFTATSATTVTGLGVVDTPTFWTGFGQAVILGLIKVGGLGVMTFTALLGLLVLRRLDLAQRLDTAASTRAPGLGDLRSVLATVVGFSALVETLVAAALTLRFLLGYGMGPGQALWNGVFPAVSAFNNAGFALFSTTLMGFVGDPFVCLPIAAAIVSGGLGLPVVAALRRHVRRPERWSLTVRLVLVGTAVLFSIVLAEVRGQGAVHAFGRRLSRSTHREAITVVLLSVLVMVTATAMLMGLSAFSTDQLAFEAVSAFATVGLSTGITAQLPPAGQAVLSLFPAGRHGGRPRTPVAVLGLGRFGRGVALELMESGFEVLGVDADERAVQDLNGLLTHVVRADTTDEEALRQLSVHEMERVVVAIGGDLADSILTVSLMKRFGIEHQWAKANDERHEETLSQLGVEHVVHPERDMGRRVAHLVSNSLQDFVAVEAGFAMVRAAAPRRFYGRDLRSLGLAGETVVRVAAMRAGGSWRYPAGHDVVGPEDTLLLIGPTREVEAFLAEG